MRTVLGMAMILAGLCACSPAEPDAAALQWAESSRPSDRLLAERYERSCMACHAARGHAAPLAGFLPHWNKRLDQGIEQLVRHASEGFKAMPAKGQCNDCTTDDLRALTQFMIKDAAR